MKYYETSHTTFHGQNMDHGSQVGYHSICFTY